MMNPSSSRISVHYVGYMKTAVSLPEGSRAQIDTVASILYSNNQDSDGESDTREAEDLVEEQGNYIAHYY